jgi:N-formylglutamate deformylase
VELSLRLYDDFYVELGQCLDEAAARGPFVVLDLHSYNHRREGADVAPAAVVANPEVNVGTGSLDRVRWRPIVDQFIEELGHRVVLDHRLDVRENVRFRGGELSRWVNERYGDHGCALAVEFKKTFMDEWTGAVDEHHLDELRRALATVVPSLITELDSLARA